MGLKHHKIFNYDPLNAREMSEIYMSDSGDRGRLFIMLELPKNKIDQQPFIDALINQIATYFDSSGQEDPEMLLEEILQELNRILPELSASTKIKNWLIDLDLAVGIIEQDSVFMASIGSINGLLIHNNQLTPILTKSSDINPTKIFSDITSGQLDEGDVLIVSTDSLFDYISKEKVKQLVKKYSPSAAAIKINELLDTVPDFVTFNSLLIKKPGIAEIEIRPEEIKSKEEREEVVSTIAPKQEKFDLSSASQPRTKLVLDVKAVKNIGPLNKIARFFYLLMWFFKYVGNIFSYIFRQLKSAFLFIASTKYRKEKEEKTLDDIKDITQKKYNWWQKLSLLKKISLLVLGALILAFIQSLVFLTQDKAIENKNESYDNALVTIQAKYTESEAKLIYNDEQSAEQLLLEVEQILKDLKANSPQQQAEIDKLKEDLFYKLNKIRKIHVVPSPVELFDLSKHNILQTNNIVQKDGKFYILADSRLYLLEEAGPTQLADFHGGQVVSSMADWENKNRLVLSNVNAANEKYYSIFDLDKKEVTGDLKIATDNSSVKDIDVYGDNLYVLDNEKNQIFKYPESGQGFAGGSKWLSEDTDLSKASSMAIDGSMYVIFDDGQIKNFIKGKANDFNYRQPHPIISSKAIIKTFRGSNYLYILDPQNKRVVIIDKEGNIKDQYASQSFDSLNDLAIDPQEKAIYLLNGSHVYLLAVNE